MKPKSLVIFITFSLCSTTLFAQFTYKQKLGSLGTVMLPNSPQIKQGTGVQFYLSKYKGILFMAQAGAVGGKLNPFHTSNPESICNSYIQGTLKGTNGTLFYEQKIKIQEHGALEFGYKAKLNGQETYRYNRITTLNDTILMCAVISSDSVSKNNPILNDFFKGFKLKNGQQIKLDNAVRLGYKTGQIIGYLVILAVLIGMGLGFVFLVKKIVYRDKR